VKEKHMETLSMCTHAVSMRTHVGFQNTPNSLENSESKKELLF